MRISSGPTCTPLNGGLGIVASSAFGWSREVGRPSFITRMPKTTCVVERPGVRGTAGSRLDATEGRLLRRRRRTVTRLTVLRQMRSTIDASLHPSFRRRIMEKVLLILPLVACPLAMAAMAGGAWAWAKLRAAPGRLRD